MRAIAYLRLVVLNEAGSVSILERGDIGRIQLPLNRRIAIVGRLRRRYFQPRETCCFQRRFFSTELLFRQTPTKRFTAESNYTKITTHHALVLYQSIARCLSEIRNLFAFSIGWPRTKSMSILSLADKNTHFCSLRLP